jgi:hypothetical protein
MDKTVPSSLIFLDRKISLIGKSSLCLALNIPDPPVQSLEQLGQKCGRKKDQKAQK